MTQRHPALLKVFDEILVNASDNRLRSTTTKPNSRNSSTTTTKIDVTIDPGCIKSKRRPFISIRNNGQGIPILIHDTEKLYIPEMVFGHLLTGSNFHDESKTKRLTGNGISLERPNIRPHVNGFKRSIVRKEDGTGFVTRGVIKQTSSTSLVISELPVGTWTNNYKLHLIKMRNLGKIQSFVENHTTTSVSFTVVLTAIQLKKIMKKGNPETTFRLETSLPSSNMHLFDEKGMIRKFSSAEEIVDAFFPVRLEMYCRRKRNMENVAEFEATLLQKPMLI